LVAPGVQETVVASTPFTYKLTEPDEQVTVNEEVLYPYLPWESVVTTVTAVPLIRASTV
jgi:hypothetical protein